MLTTPENAATSVAWGPGAHRRGMALVPAPRSRPGGISWPLATAHVPLAISNKALLSAWEGPIAVEPTEIQQWQLWSVA